MVNANINRFLIYKLINTNIFYDYITTVIVTCSKSIDFMNEQV